MATIFDVYENIKNLNIEVLVKKAIASTSNIMADLNRKQLLEGKKANGRYMPLYSNMSVEVFGKPQGNIILKETGAFHKSIEVDIGGDEFNFVADDIHDLEKKYSNDIYGLTKDNKENYATDTVLPIIQNDITAQTGLKFN